MKWTEALLAKAVQQVVFNRAVVLIPNCNWTGHECDLLGITKDLRVIDVEIKTSRADLKADIKKDKWWTSQHWSRRHEPRQPRGWPPKVWKHYYVMPAEIWETKLLETINPVSGVVLASADGKLRVIRKAKPNRLAKPVTAASAIDLARLANLRMWAALVRQEI